MTDVYVLESQVGHLLRRANQRHTALFARRFMAFDLTPLQFAVLMKLREAGPLSQNLLGRQTAMDPNTVQGVILRLLRRRLIDRSSSPEDKRRKVLALTAEGSALADQAGHRRPRHQRGDAGTAQRRPAPAVPHAVGQAHVTATDRLLHKHSAPLMCRPTEVRASGQSARAASRAQSGRRP